MSERDAAFEAYFAARSGAMRGTAYLLCGDWHRAEDLVQQTFTKIYLAWHRIDRREAMDNYTRQALVRTFLSERRRGWFRFESVGAEAADRPAPGSGLADERMVLLAALMKVPPRQRAVLVLRYWEDASVEQAAALLDCSEGNVKSQAARGLQTLRGLLQEERVR
ncbi:SigE family RNA polymerase sigma factor [Kribbella qitaiheensis]|uniref:SigE family RNA polymerase sigma factor n=1 Tax=Kribbella qitaiheensis TaxID=1544730 RepID=A0A7G6WSJ2_9ACTN|nr:SigE family RNA polymerase sigma factor [Kribbella qitaiheensis]QNE16957.1 SigE family RNA polymerase sigma factor [Kribbella qitaiheensis]